MTRNDYARQPARKRARALGDRAYRTMPSVGTSAGYSQIEPYGERQYAATRDVLGLR